MVWIAAAQQAGEYFYDANAMKGALNSILGADMGPKDTSKKLVKTKFKKYFGDKAKELYKQVPKKGPDGFRERAAQFLQEQADIKVDYGLAAAEVALIAAAHWRYTVACAELDQAGLKLPAVRTMLKDIADENFSTQKKVEKLMRNKARLRKVNHRLEEVGQMIKETKERAEAGQQAAIQGTVLSGLGLALGVAMSGGLVGTGSLVARLGGVVGIVGSAYTGGQNWNQWSEANTIIRECKSYEVWILQCTDIIGRRQKGQSVDDAEIKDLVANSVTLIRDIRRVQGKAEPVEPEPEDEDDEDSDWDDDDDH